MIFAQRGRRRSAQAKRMKRGLLTWLLAMLSLSVGCSAGCQDGARSNARTATATDTAARGGATCPEGAPRAVNRVRFYPAPGRAAAMVGGHFQGSNTGPTNDFVDFAMIHEAPTEGAFGELRFANDGLFRYLKYYSPDGSYGGIAELEFYRDDVRLDGEAFGTASPGEQGAFTRALDRDPGTAFVAASADGNYVGIDIGRAAVVAEPAFSAAPGPMSVPGAVSISSATSDASIRYTLDGSLPSRSRGQVYTGPIAVPDGSTIIKAIAYADCLFASPVVQATYTAGVQSAAAPKRGLKSYHVGNSLTDTINPWLEPIADSAGVDHKYARWTIPGATVKWIWEHKGEGFGTPQGAERFDEFVRTFAPIDHLSVQPYADPSLDNEAKAAAEMYAAARAHSPDLQLWIYAQWPSRSEWSKDGFATGASWAAPPWKVAAQPKSWEEAARGQVAYHEAFRQYVDDHVPGKSVLVVPAGLALVELKRAIEAGTVPGISDFFSRTFSDDLHLTAPGQYLVGLVFYACLYQASPEGRVTSAGSELSAQQARIYQRIAWEVVRGYTWSGVVR